MKNGILTMRVFEILDEVAQRHRVSDTMWAKASGLGHQPRIYELRKKAEMARRGEDSAKLRRAFTVEKCKKLVDALKSIIGEDIVNRELASLIDNAKTTQEKIMLKVLSLSKKEEEKLWEHLSSSEKTEE